MKIPLTINNQEQLLDVPPGERLVSVLRTKMHLNHVKRGCEKGYCGTCTILIDDKIALSCITPIFLLKNCHVTTFEYFSTTEDCADIRSAFEKNDIHLCGFCSPSRFFIAHTILTKYPRPTKEQISQSLYSSTCNCTDNDSLINSIILAAAIRRKRKSEK